MGAMNTLTKIWDILTPEQRRGGLALFGLMIVGMLFETLGVGLVIPALAVMAQDDFVARYPTLVRWLGTPTRDRMILFGMIMLVAVFALKTLFLIFLVWRQMRFVYGLQAELSERIFTGYLRQPYTFHLQRNSAHLIRNAFTDSALFAQTELMAGLSFLTELLVVVGVSILLLIVEPAGALIVVTILGAAGWGFHRLTNNRILRWGEARQHHDGFRMQHLQQGLGAAKDVKLLGRESAFLAQYRRHNDGSARAGRRLQTLQQLPRLVLEILAVCGLAGLVLTMITQGKPLDTLVPTLGLFAAAAFRLMPSANRLVGAAQNMRYALPVVGTLHEEVALIRGNEIQQRGAPLAFANSLRLDKVSFRYPGSEASVLCDVTLRVRYGTSVGFIGGSGAGKSTLVDVILGLLAPAAGKVCVDGVDIQTNLRGWQDRIGYVPQSVFLTDDTFRRNVAFGLADEDIDDDAVWRALRAAQLEAYVKSLPDGLDTTVGERGIRLSGGQLQRIGIARALYHDPPVLVLDEATSSLDAATERGVMQAVYALHGQKTVLIVAHRLSTVEQCDHLYRLEDGRIADQGVPADMIQGSTLRVLGGAS
jgi:ABC-type multidrug transport system fused ATPase/permease subunit